jgi:choline dehydrogenase-like flavoprotein
MIVDARSLPTGTLVETDVCIIGAGAAGITLAREFNDARFQVALLESGGMDYEPETQELYQGRSIGRPFQDLTASRLRFFGGTTNHWGGWCLPYDAIDFEARDDLPYHGWPFEKSHLDPWYQRAQEVCQIGPYDYRPTSWGSPANAVPPPFSGPHFERKILQVSSVHFGPAYGAELRRAPRVSVYLHANAFHLDAGETEAEIREVLVKTLSGNHFTVRARIYILATGGIENARLMLTSGKEGGAGLGNAHDLVGRFLLVHLVYNGGAIVLSDPHMNLDFSVGGERADTGGKHSFVSLIGLSASSIYRLHLPKILISLGYRFSPIIGAVKALKRLIGGEGPGGSLLGDLSEVIGNLDGVTSFAVRKTLFGEGVPIEALDLGCASEQQPNPQSRVLLGVERDRLGMREVVVDWQLTAEDKSKAAATLHLLGAEVGRAQFGRLRSSLSDDDSWPDGFYGDEHHLGTTRMHRDPALGVVDENCRVHTLANLYVAGSSVFPNSSANNSTLTIVALALRLADHVKKRLM